MSGSAPSRFRHHPLHGWLGLLARLGLGGVFLGACAYKIWDPHEFGLSIATYEIMPLSLINLMAVCLPWVELIIGLTFIAGLWTRASALAINGMLLMFIVALFIALSRDMQLSCGCFASQEAADEIGMHTVIRDFGMLLPGLYVMIFDDGRVGVDGWLRNRRARAS